MNEPVLPSLTATEAEALIHFIATRKALWDREAKDFGVEDPERAPRELITAHAKAVRRHFKPRRAA